MRYPSAIFVKISQLPYLFPGTNVRSGLAKRQAGTAEMPEQHRPAIPGTSALQQYRATVVTVLVIVCLRVQHPIGRRIYRRTCRCPQVHTEVHIATRKMRTRRIKIPLLAIASPQHPPAPSSPPSRKVRPKTLLVIHRQLSQSRIAPRQIHQQIIRPGIRPTQYRKVCHTCQIFIFIVKNKRGYLCCTPRAAAFWSPENTRTPFKRRCQSGRSIRPPCTSAQYLRHPCLHDHSKAIAMDYPDKD